MKRRHLAIISISLVLGMCLTGCSTTSDSVLITDTGKSTAYITKAAVFGDESGLMAGTFTLPSGKTVSPGWVIQDGNWLYTATTVKTKKTDSNSVDLSGATEEARMNGMESLAYYFESRISSESTKSSTSSKAMSEAVIQGMEIAGFMMGNDGSAYFLLKVHTRNISVARSATTAGSKSSDIIETTKKTSGGVLNKILGN